MPKGEKSSHTGKPRRRVRRLEARPWATVNILTGAGRRSMRILRSQVLQKNLRDLKPLEITRVRQG